MLMTTVLLVEFIISVYKKYVFGAIVGIVFGAIEMVFLISSLDKFVKGGYVAILLSIALFLVMIIWHRGTAIEDMQRVKLPIANYITQLRELHDDTEIEKKAANMVFFVKEPDADLMDRDVLYSILDKDSKRADAYWFLNVNVLDTPNDMNYEVNNFGTDFLF